MSDAPQPRQRQGATSPRRRRTSGELVRLGLAAVVGGLIAAFTFLNTQQVSVNWIVTTTKTPLIVVILLSLVVGGILVAAAFAGRKRSVARKRRADRAQRSHLSDQ